MPTEVIPIKSETELGENSTDDFNTPETSPTPREASFTADEAGSNSHRVSDSSLTILLETEGGTSIEARNEAHGDIEADEFVKVEIDSSSDSAEEGTEEMEVEIAQVSNGKLSGEVSVVLMTIQTVNCELKM